MGKIAAGNWKMNGSQDALAEVAALLPMIAGLRCDVVLCPPATLIAAMVARAEGSALRVGGQTCHAAANGAHTGDISAPMLAEAGASHVIVGHSERRADHGERSADVAAQAHAAHDAGLTPIICLGESAAERDAGVTLNVITTQLRGSIPEGLAAADLVIAYEPIWAIGTGRVASTEQIAEVHDHLRSELGEIFGAEAAADVPLLYGGSVKPGNAAEIFAVSNVDGALVGGASLKAADFGPIAQALDAA